METNEKLTEFLATLPPALTRHGAARANDVTLAKAIRADLAAAVTAGIFPAGTTFSVRINHHSSLTVEIMTWPGPVYTPEYEAHLADPTKPNPADGGWRRNESDGYTAPDLYRAKRDADRIADRHNYDESDPMTDHFNVGYYLTVYTNTIDHARKAAINLATNPAFSDLLAKGKLAAVALGKKATASILGRGGLDSASEWELNHLIKVAARANGSPVAYDKRRRGWFPVAASAE
jgi:hypothetical protein